MRKLVFLLFLTFFTSISYGQDFSIQGRLYDSLISKSIPFGSIALLQSDSSLVASERSDLKGNFSFNYIDSGQYILLIAHPKYVTHSRQLKINSNNTIGNLTLFQKKQLLRKVVIRDRKAILVRGDTVSFAADSFNTKTGDVVEDLLKLLPGMQVDGSGNITSQGKKVETVLVNGEEFFGNDPTVATQNLPSRAVEKVEVFDSKDAQEQFTGFTSDKDTKVINLKLKKEMNKGSFGKIASHGGWEDRWTQKFLINKFNDKEQLGGYYLSSSNGMANMGWEESNSYGGTNTGGDGTSNQFNGGAQNGITKSWKTGARYANKFEKSNQELNINYGNLRSRRERSSRSYTENLLPENTFFKSDTNTSTNTNTSHALNARYKTDIDSMLRLDYRFRFSVADRTEQSNASSYNRDNNEAPISFNARIRTNNTISTNVSNQITLNRKFKKEKRTLSLSLNHTYGTNNSDGYLKSNNALNLLNGGQNNFLDQKKDVTTSNRYINSKIVFTEPISKKLRIKLSYNYTDSKNKNSNITSDTLGYDSGNFNNQLDSLSNIFSSRSLTNSPGFELRFENKKWRTSVGGNINFTEFEQFDVLRSNDFSYKQTNYIPSVRVQYKISKYKKIRLSYSGRTTMPNSNQLQPFQDNTNPLSIVQGNPNLRMGYSQNIRLNYNANSRMTGSYMGLWMTIGNNINRIGTHRIFESSGRTITTYENLPNGYNSYIGTYLSKRISGSNFKYGAYIWGNYSYNPNLINNISGNSQIMNANISPSLNYYNEELLSFEIDLETKYKTNSNKGNVDRTVAYFSYSPSIDLNIFLPGFVDIGAYLVYNYQPAVEPFTTPFTRTYMKSSISKKFLSKRNLTFRFEVFDVFNQNKGYNRQSDVNYNTESFYSTLGRYWMIGATWNFFSGPTAVKRQSSGKNEKSGQGWLGKKKSKKEEMK